MTGYGRGMAQEGDRRLVVELTSVNRKNLEVQWNAPRDLDPLEPQARDLIGKSLSRGRVTGRMFWEGSGHGSSSGAQGGRSGAKAGSLPIVQDAVLEAYLQEFKRLRETNILPEEIKTEWSLQGLMRLPGVVALEETALDLDEVLPLLEKAMEGALKDLLKMRSREGLALKEEMLSRAQLMLEALQRVELNAPKVLESYRAKLIERIAQAGIEPPGADDDRLMREIVYFADRSDITEEVTRLKSHFQQLEDCFQDKEPVGRKLDFLAQEFNREINTIGSKANDATIATEVVFLKTELEKLREQFQNIE